MSPGFHTICKKFKMPFILIFDVVFTTMYPILFLISLCMNCIARTESHGNGNGSAPVDISNNGSYKSSSFRNNSTGDHSKKNKRVVRQTHMTDHVVCKMTNLFFENDRPLTTALRLFP